MQGLPAGMLPGKTYALLPSPVSNCLRIFEACMPLKYGSSAITVNGFDIAERPAPARPYNALVYTYMLGKYTGRWSFYRVSALLARAADPRGVNEVVNPGKDEKLAVVAGRHGIDPVRFVRTGRTLRRFWPLLP